MLRLAPKLPVAMVIVAVLLASGCVKRTADMGSITWAFELWAAASVLLGSLAASVAGFFLRGFSSRLGWGMLIAGPVILLFIAPGLFLDRVELDSEHFTLQTGLWFMPTRHDVRFDDLEKIEITDEISRGRRGRRQKSVYLCCYKKGSGEMDKVPVGTLMEEAAAEVLDGAAAHGVEIIDSQDDQ